MGEAERYRISTATILRSVEWHNVFQADYGDYDEEMGEFITNLQETGNRPVPFEILDEPGVIPLMNKTLKAEGFEIARLAPARKGDEPLFYLRRLEQNVRR